MVCEMLITNKTNVHMNVCQLLVEVYKLSLHVDISGLYGHVVF
jgi:hypothetical protein